MTYRELIIRPTIENDGFVIVLKFHKGRNKTKFYYKDIGTVNAIDWNFSLSESNGSEYVAKHKIRFPQYGYGFISKCTLNQSGKTGEDARRQLIEKSKEVIGKYGAMTAIELLTTMINEADRLRGRPGKHHITPEKLNRILYESGEFEITKPRKNPHSSPGARVFDNKPPANLGEENETSYDTGARF